MDFNDHSKGFPKATKASFISGIPKIHHNKCGGRVTHSYNADGWGCNNCRAGWHDDIVARWRDDDFEIRFHLRGDIDTKAFVIVWTTTGKNRHTTLVPATEADKFERFVL